MERKDSCSYLPRDDQSTGNFGMAKTFLISFLLRPAPLLSLRGCLRTPSGQKFFTLPKDNWPKETKFLLSRGTTKAEGRRRKQI